MDGYLPVKVNVPLEDYRRLNAEAQGAKVTVAERIAQLLKAPSPKPQARMGRPSGYTTQHGEEIASDRRFGKTWAAIAESLAVSEYTARAWLRKYENEVREQNTRDRAERKAS